MLKKAAVLVAFTVAFVAVVVVGTGVSSDPSQVAQIEGPGPYMIAR